MGSVVPDQTVELVVDTPRWRWSMASSAMGRRCAAVPQDRHRKLQGCRSIRRRVAQCRSYRPRRRLGGDGSSGRTGIGSLRQRRGLGAGSAIWRRRASAVDGAYCVGIPRQGQRPIVLDFATSIVAEGKVLVASRGGKKLPKGALIDLEGTLSEDPAVLYEPHSAEEPRDHSQGKGRSAPLASTRARVWRSSANYSAAR
jgi:hydroxycarboxylate dehydrogenase B